MTGGRRHLCVTVMGTMDEYLSFVLAGYLWPMQPPQGSLLSWSIFETGKARPPWKSDISRVLSVPGTEKHSTNAGLSAFLPGGRLP